MFLFVITKHSLRQLSFHEKLLKLVQVSQSHVLYQDDKTILISDMPSIRNEDSISIWISGNSDHSIKNVNDALISVDWERFGSRFQFNKTAGYWKLETDLTGVFSPSFLKLNGAFLMADDHKLFLQLEVPGLKENPNWIADIIISGFPHDNTNILLPLVRAPANYLIKGEFESIQAASRLPKIWHYNDALTPEETVEQAKAELENILSKYKKYSFGLQLTGGYDSRLLLATFLRLGIYPKTYIYGVHSNYNSDIAQDLADSLKLDHTFIPLNKKFEKILPELLLEAEIATGGISSPSHTHIFYAAKQVTSDVNHLVSGIAGGELHRGINDEAPVMPWLLSNIVRHGEKACVIDKSNSLVSKIIPEWQPLVNERIRSLTLQWRKECKEALLPEIILRNVFGGFYRSLFLLENLSLNTEYPLLDSRYLNILLRSPYGIVYGKNMHANIFDKLRSQRNLIKGYHPSPDPFFSLTSDKGFPPKYLLFPFTWPRIPFLVWRSRRIRANLGELDNARWLKLAYNELGDLVIKFLPELKKADMDRWLNKNTLENGKVAISRILHIALARYAISALRQ